MKRNRQGSVGILLVVLTDILFSHSNAFSLVLATDKPRSSLAREYKALPDTVVDKYLIKGNVTIRSVDWCQKNMPLQVYRGSRLQTSRRRLTPPHETAAPTSSTTTACASKGLLQSSQFLVDNIDDLSGEKRGQLQMKMAAEARASQPLEPDEHLHILYCDEHICVTSKPSGVLSVPGPRRNPSLAGLVHETLAPDIPIDQMVVHRLDMDTSGKKLRRRRRRHHLDHCWN